MNFHKTIGYLATLLLIVGFGASDSFAQTTPTTTLSFSRPNYVREGSSVDVIATVSPALDATETMTVTVNLSLTSVNTFALPGGTNAYEAAATDADDASAISTIEVVVTGSSGESTVYIKNDDAYYDGGGTLEITSDTESGTSGAANVNYPAGAAKTLSIRDNDNDTGGAITLTVSPHSFSVAADADQTVTLTVELEEVPEAAVTVSVDAELVSGSGDDATTVTLTVANIEVLPTVTNDAGVASANKKATGPLVLDTDQDDAAGAVSVTVSAPDYTSADARIPVISRTAEDVEGFRVTLMTPGASGAWAGAKASSKQFVRFNVTRLNRTQSYPWTTFQSVAVSLRDTSTGIHNIMTLTAGNLTNQNGEIVSTKSVANSGETDAATATLGDYKITYNEPTDKLTFEFKLPKVTAEDVVPTLGTVGGERETTAGDDLAGSIDDPNAEDNHPRAGDTAKGQRVGVYAHVTFSDVNGVVGSINSRDEEKKVFSNPATPGADQNVGDGKLIKLDLLPPGNIVEADALAITLNNSDEDAEDANAKAGDEVKAAVSISSQTRFIRDGGMKIEFKTANNSDDFGNAKATPLGNETFDQAEISAAAGKTLRASLNLTPGKIVTRASNPDYNRDGEELEKNKASSTFEPDNVEVDVLVTTTDQAGNASDAVSKQFTADTRAPGIHVLYPAAGDRITGDHEGTNWDEFLNPLRIRVDEEELDSLYVYADGAEGAEDVTAENFFDVFEISNTKSGRPAILLWSPDDGVDLDRSEVVTRAGTTTVGDTIIYNTESLLYRKSNNKLEVTGQSGTAIDLKVVGVDLVGNRTVVTLDGVTLDEKLPSFNDYFPRNALLEDDDNQINEATRHPVIDLKEALDSLSVTYDPTSGNDIVVEVKDLAKDEHQIIVTDPFVADQTYTLTIFARDLAGNSYETDGSAEAANMVFNADFDNPKANMFTIRNFDPTDMPEDAQSDSVVAGQAFHLRLKAFDNSGTPDDDDDDRAALTYKNGELGDLDTQASEVRISAWDADGAAETVRFHGKGVSDNGNGSATLDADSWKLGERTVWAKSNKIIDNLKILVEHRNAGEGDTSVPAFKGAIEDLTVDAADFAKFEITSLEDGVEAAEVWGSFTLQVVPIDRHGNPSVKVYRTKPAAKAAGAADSLNILDTRVDTKVDNVTKGFNYKNGIRVNIGTSDVLSGIPSALTSWLIPSGGQSFTTRAPENLESVLVQVAVLNSFLTSGDTRSENIVSEATIIINEPLDLSITILVDGVDKTDETIIFPAGGSVDVTVRAGAEGLNEGDTITLTTPLGSVDLTADADGYAEHTVSVGTSGTTTVTVSSGQDEANVDIVAEEAPAEPTRVPYVNDAGEDVYLISKDDLTVGANDLLALLAAFNEYNVQADLDDDGDVDIDDFLKLIGSWGRTAVDDGPATKPIVLLPGVNENAEFSLSLGSERVVAGELMAIDVSLANVAALMGYGFALNYEADKFEFISVAPADEDLLTSTGGETLFHHVVADGQISVATGMYNGTAISGGGDIVRFVFRVLREFEDNARFEIADGLVFDPSQLQNPAVVAGVLELQSTPREFALRQNFPNPFNPDTTIKYDLAESADVTLQIYNVLGQVVRTLVGSEAQNAGRYQIRWNGMDDRGVPVSSGVYFYQISAGKFQDVRKLMMLK